MSRQKYINLFSSSAEIFVIFSNLGVVSWMNEVNYRKKC